MTISKAIALPGDDVTVTCRLANVANFQLVNILKVIVRQPGSYPAGASQYLTEIIMQNAVLANPYKDAARFEAIPASEGSDVIYTLKIKSKYMYWERFIHVKHNIHNVLLPEIYMRFI